MSELEYTSFARPGRPTTDDPAVWRAYWHQIRQPWRTEPEISEERQKYLTDRRAIVPDIEQGIYPFKNIKLSRADVEWLLATHEDGRGPVDWNDPTQHGRAGLDLRGSCLSEINLQNLPLAGLQGGLAVGDAREATEEQRSMAAIHLDGANVTDAHLEGSVLSYAHLEGATLYEAHLESVDAFHAYFQGTKPAKFRGVFFDSATNLEQAIIANDRHVGARFLDIHWGEANITKIDWAPVHLLFDEEKALNPHTTHGRKKERTRRIREYQEAIRAYRQLTVVLRSQGVDEDAARFAYRAQRLQRVVLGFQRNYAQYLFSLLLDLLAGYGYRPIRTLLWNLFVVGCFTFTYALFGHLPTFPDALVYSLTSFHGRGFFPGLGSETTLHNPLVVVAAAEAVIGLFIEISFIATFTQRYFGK